MSNAVSRFAWDSATINVALSGVTAMPFGDARPSASCRTDPSVPTSTIIPPRTFTYALPRRSTTISFPVLSETPRRSAYVPSDPPSSRRRTRASGPATMSRRPSGNQSMQNGRLNCVRKITSRLPSRSTAPISCAPIREPQTVLVPPKRFTHPESRQQRSENRATVFDECKHISRHLVSELSRLTEASLLVEAAAVRIAALDRHGEVLATRLGQFRQPRIEEPDPDAVTLPLRQHVDSRQFHRRRGAPHVLRESDDAAGRFRDENARPLQRERAAQALRRVPAVEQPALTFVGNDAGIRGRSRRARDSLDLREVPRLGSPDDHAVLPHGRTPTRSTGQDDA